jgi:hypothetical protein
MRGPRGIITGVGMIVSSTATSDDGKFSGECLSDTIDASNSAHIFFSELPTKVIFGDNNKMEKFMLSQTPVQR